jgi:hypothetical protein
MARTHRLTIRLLKLEVKDPEDALTVNLKKSPIKQGYPKSPLYRGNPTKK